MEYCPELLAISSNVELSLHDRTGFGKGARNACPQLSKETLVNSTCFHSAVSQAEHIFFCQAHRWRHQGSFLPAVLCETAEIRHRRSRPRHRVCAPLHWQRAQWSAIQQAVPE